MRRVVGPYLPGVLTKATRATTSAAWWASGRATATEVAFDLRTAEEPSKHGIAMKATYLAAVRVEGVVMRK